MLQMVASVVRACKQKEGASRTDVDELFTRKPPSTREGKCLRACVGETSDIV